MHQQSILRFVALILIGWALLSASACAGGGQPAGTQGPTFTPAPIEAPTATPGPVATGKIAFVSNRDGNYEIYVMNADGSGLTNLTNNPADDSEPAWSPDGTRIGFVSGRDGNGEIYVMNADGSGQTRLTDNPTSDAFPTWSPDGTRIAFIFDRLSQPQLYVMNADGSGQTRLNDKANFFVAWSPDGSRIAFVSLEGGISIMNADGSGLTRLGADGNFPVWSPDGSRIAFARGSDIGLPTQLWVMNADGSGQARLAEFLSSGFLAWSPDGGRIAVQTSTGGGGVSVINADSSASGRTAVTTAPNGTQIWSPNGSHIVFTSEREGNWEIYVRNVEGSGQTNLTNNPADDFDPAWSPLP